MSDGKRAMAESIDRHTEVLGLPDGAIAEALVAAGVGDLLPDTTQQVSKERTAEDSAATEDGGADLIAQVRAFFPDASEPHVRTTAAFMAVFDLSFDDGNKKG